MSVRWLTKGHDKNGTTKSHDNEEESHASSIVSLVLRRRSWFLSRLQRPGRGDSSQLLPALRDGQWPRPLVLIAHGTQEEAVTEAVLDAVAERGPLRGLGELLLDRTHGVRAAVVGRGPAGCIIVEPHGDVIGLGMAGFALTAEILGGAADGRPEGLVGDVDTEPRGFGRGERLSVWGCFHDMWRTSHL
jgi:hypothetical protein